MAKNPHEGSSFDDFLKEDGLYEECTAAALKKVLAWQLEEEMKNKKITKKIMAERMQTSRSQLDRLLDPEKTGVSLETMQWEASVVGRELRIQRNQSYFIISFRLSIQYLGNLQTVERKRLQRPKR